MKTVKGEMSKKHQLYVPHVLANPRKYQTVGYQRKVYEELIKRAKEQFRLTKGQE